MARTILLVRSPLQSNDTCHSCFRLRIPVGDCESFFLRFDPDFGPFHSKQSNKFNELAIGETEDCRNESTTIARPANLLDHLESC